MRLLLIFLSLFSPDYKNFTNIYDYSIITIEGVNKSLVSYQGKKIIIVTLPVVQNEENSTYLRHLDSLSTVFKSSAVMVGFPSYEDGFETENTEALKTWYRSVLGSQFLVSTGVYTRKSALQNELFQWLTHKELNQHFDVDVESIGQQFFISISGNLYAVLDGEGKSNDKIFNKLIQQ